MIDVSAPERTAHLTLPDGRRLAWSEWGPADGRPVLFCTGAAMGGSLYQRDDFAAAYRRSLAEGFRQGAAGYARDLRICLGPWPTPPERIGVPVDLWYGLADISPVHSPDHGTTLARRFPDARHHLSADEGGSILWTRAADILTALRDRLG